MLLQKQNQRRNHIITTCKRQLLTTDLTNYSLFQGFFGRVSSVHFQALMMKTLRYKCYNKRIKTCDNGNVQSHYKEESTLNSTINSTFNKDLFTRACCIGTMVLINVLI